MSADSSDVGELDTDIIMRALAKKMLRMLVDDEYNDKNLCVFFDSKDNTQTDDGMIGVTIGISVGDLIVEKGAAKKGMLRRAKNAMAGAFVSATRAMKDFGSKLTPQKKAISESAAPETPSSDKPAAGSSESAAPATPSSEQSAAGSSDQPAADSSKSAAPATPSSKQSAAGSSESTATSSRLSEPPIIIQKKNYIKELKDNIKAIDILLKDNINNIGILNLEDLKSYNNIISNIDAINTKKLNEIIAKKNITSKIFKKIHNIKYKPNIIKKLPNNIKDIYNRTKGYTNNNIIPNELVKLIIRSQIIKLDPTQASKLDKDIKQSIHIIEKEEGELANLRTTSGLFTENNKQEAAEAASTEESGAEESEEENLSSGGPAVMAETPIRKSNIPGSNFSQTNPLHREYGASDRRLDFGQTKRGTSHLLNQAAAAAAAHQGVEVKSS